MKITFLLPSVGKIKGMKYVKSWQMQPLSIATLAGLTPDEHEIEFIDDRFDKILYDKDTDLVAMSVETYTAQRAYTISREFRNRNIPVVMGGIHAVLASDEVMRHSDSVVIGDAESVWGKVLEDIENNNTQKTYISKERNGRLPHVKARRDLYEGKPYIGLDMVETGRGCVFTCDFCAIAGSFEGSYRSKSIDDIISDVSSIKGKNLYFVDDNFVSKFGRTKELCRQLIPLEKRWFSHGSINMANDSELLNLLEKSGCANILIGFETLNPKILEAMGKSWNTSKRDYNESISKLRDHGITVYGTFVFGYDEDTQDDFKRTLDFAIEQKLALAAFNHLVPFPGTPLYSRLKKEGRLFEDEWWLREGYKFGEVVFQPKNMSAETLAEKCFECRNQFYNYSSTFKRMFDLKANFKSPYQGIVYLAANLISKKGITQRQYWPIGQGDEESYNQIIDSERSTSDKQKDGLSKFDLSEIKS